MNRTTRQMIIKGVEDLNNIINQLDLRDILKTLHRTTAEYTVFSSTQGTFSKRDHMLAYKTNLNKCKRIEIIQSMLSALRVQMPSFKDLFIWSLH